MEVRLRYITCHHYGPTNAAETISHKTKAYLLSTSSKACCFVRSWPTYLSQHKTLKKKTIDSLQAFNSHLIIPTLEGLKRRWWGNYFAMWTLKSQVLTHIMPSTSPFVCPFKDDNWRWVIWTKWIMWGLQHKPIFRPYQCIDIQKGKKQFKKKKIIKCG